MEKDKALRSEIINALAEYYGEGRIAPSEESILSELREEHDPVTVISESLTAYRDK